MDMIITHVPGKDWPILPFTDHLEDYFQLLFDVPVCEYLPPIFRGPDKTVLADVGTMIQRTVETCVGYINHLLSWR
jgi:hypothetical protein